MNRRIAVWTACSGRSRLTERRPPPPRGLERERVPPFEDLSRAICSFGSVGRYRFWLVGTCFTPAARSRGVLVRPGGIVGGAS